MRSGGDPSIWRVTPLAADWRKVAESPDPDRVYLGTPSIEVLPGGRIVASHDFFGPGVADLPGPKGTRPHYNQTLQGEVLTSDDNGLTWQHRFTFPFFHARLFRMDSTLYLLGHCGRVLICRSDDGGETWSNPAELTEYDAFTQTAANVLITDQNVYLVMMQIADPTYPGYFISEMAPVLMRGARGTDLTDPGNWSFSRPASPFKDMVPEDELDYGGFPFYTATVRSGEDYVEGEQRRKIFNIGWSEAGVVRIEDPNHYWYDPAGRTFHLFGRFENHLSNYAAIAVVKESEDGEMSLGLQTTPSGRTMAFTPMPGGQMRFHILYDPPTRLYWLVSTQSTDSMTRIDRLPPDRFQLPYNERQRLQLHFSKNMIDWVFAGLVDTGASALESRHYCSAVVQGDDLLILSRSGDGINNPNPHDTNLITLHRISSFRDLVY